ncbi:hypothetical protein B0J14DRAFT_589746 [Halenospora varia]|nr:hypothetical protein B0J14DRAFT_589746 [Halenospora varia]
MLFQASSILSLLALTGVLSAASIRPQKRTSVSDISLWGYGAYSNGAKIFYSEGLAYIGLTGLDDVTGVQTNITFTEDPNDTTVPWTITANSSTVTFNETLYMYIVPDSGNMTQVGFAANGSVPDGGVTTGFAWFGKNVAYAASESDYEMMFWGLNTTTEGVFGLYWNGGSLLDGAFPVTVKSTAPTHPTS